MAGGASDPQKKSNGSRKIVAGNATFASVSQHLLLADKDLVYNIIKRAYQHIIAGTENFKISPPTGAEPSGLSVLNVVILNFQGKSSFLLAFDKNKQRLVYTYAIV